MKDRSVFRVWYYKSYLISLKRYLQLKKQKLIVQIDNKLRMPNKYSPLSIRICPCVCRSNPWIGWRRRTPLACPFRSWCPKRRSPPAGTGRRGRGLDRREDLPHHPGNVDLDWWVSRDVVKRGSRRVNYIFIGKDYSFHNQYKYRTLQTW